MKKRENQKYAVKEVVEANRSKKKRSRKSRRGRAIWHMWCWKSERNEKRRLFKVIRRIRGRFEKGRFKSINGEDFLPRRELKEEGFLPTT